MPLYHAKGFGQIEKTGSTGGRLLAVTRAGKGNTPGRGQAPLAAAPGVTRACTKKAPARYGQGIEKPAHMEPVVSNPIFNIPGVILFTAPAMYDADAGDLPQAAKRCSISCAVCKCVAMCSFPFHFLYLQ